MDSLNQKQHPSQNSYLKR